MSSEKCTTTKYAGMIQIAPGNWVDHKTHMQIVRMQFAASRASKK